MILGAALVALPSLSSQALAATQAKDTVKKTGIVCFQYPDGVDFGSEKAQLVFGIAGIGDEHLDLLGKLCTLLEDPALLETLKTTDDVDWVLKQLT